MSDIHEGEDSQITADEHELQHLEQEENELAGSSHQGFADALRGNRLRDEIQALDTKILHEREGRIGGT